MKIQSGSVNKQGTYLTKRNLLKLVARVSVEFDIRKMLKELGLDAAEKSAAQS